MREQSITWRTFPKAMKYMTERAQPMSMYITTPGTVAAPAVAYRAMSLREIFMPRKYTVTGWPLAASMEAGSMSTWKATMSRRKILRPLTI